MTKYYKTDIPTKIINCYYGTRQSGKTYHELINEYTPKELRQFEKLKERIRSYNIKRIDYIIRVLLTDRYDEYVEYIRKD